MSSYIPALIAFGGVMVGLSVNRNWNYRVERRERFLDVLELAFDLLYALREVERLEALEGPRSDREKAERKRVKQLRRDLNRRSTALVLIARRDVVAGAQALRRTTVPDGGKVNSLELYRRIALLRMVARKDLNLDLREGSRIRKSLRTIHETDWYKRTYVENRQTWFKDLDARIAAELEAASGS